MIQIISICLPATLTESLKVNSTRNESNLEWSTKREPRFKLQAKTKTLVKESSNVQLRKLKTE